MTLPDWHGTSVETHLRDANSHQGPPQTRKPFNSGAVRPFNNSAGALSKLKPSLKIGLLEVSSVKSHGSRHACGTARQLLFEVPIICSSVPRDRFTGPDSSSSRPTSRGARQSAPMIQSIVLEWLFLTVQVTSKVRTFNLRTNTAFGEIMVKELYTRVFVRRGRPLC
jgi:hypothetical protein